MSSNRAAPGESAKQFAAAHAAASCNVSDGEKFDAIPNAKPAKAESPQPTVDRGFKAGAGANKIGAFTLAQNRSPSGPRDRAALRAPSSSSLPIASVALCVESTVVPRSCAASSEFGFTKQGRARNACLSASPL